MDYRNPSKKVTELLSSYLEFNKEQLDVGIWSGDLSMRQVKLRKSAFQSILNPSKSASSDTDLSSRRDFDDLDISLINGTIGDLRLKIPWKNLVLGVGGKTQIELSDVNIWLKFENHAVSTGKWKASSILCKEEKVNPIKQDKVESEEEHQRKTFEKQALIAQAERCLLDHLPTPSQDLPREKPKPENDSEKKISEEKTNSKLKNILIKVVSYFATSIGFRVGKGLHLCIRNVRIGFIQDGIEFGVVINEINLHDDKTKIPCTKSGDSNKQSESSKNYAIAKSCAIHDIGIFVREIDSNRKRRKTKLDSDFSMIQSLLSIPIESDDYIIQPFNSDMKIYLFPQNKYTTNDENVDDREHTTIEDEITSKENDTSIMKSKNKALSFDHNPKNDADKPILTSDEFKNDTYISPKERSSLGDSSIKEDIREKYDTITELQSERKTAQILKNPNDEMSADCHVSMNQTSMEKANAIKAPPQMIINIQINQIVTVLSTHHFKQIRGLVTGISTLKKGRPEIRISSFLRQPVRRSSHGSRAKSNSVSIKDSIISKRSLTVDSGARSNPVFTKEKMISRSEVIRSWWHYAFINVVLELRKTKRLANKFRENLPLSRFDWNKQKCHRRQYIDLYTLLRLKKHSVSHNDGLEKDQTNVSNIEELLLSEIELKLPVEQILLYRYLARSIHLGWKSQMAQIIQKDQYTSSNSDQVFEPEDYDNGIAHKKEVHMSYSKSEFDYHGNQQQGQTISDEISYDFLAVNEAGNSLDRKENLTSCIESPFTIPSDTIPADSDKGSNLSLSFNIGQFSFFICNEDESKDISSHVQTKFGAPKNFSNTQFVSSETSTAGEESKNTIHDESTPNHSSFFSGIILHKRHHEIILAMFISGASLLGNFYFGNEKKIQFSTKGILIENKGQHLLSCGSTESVTKPSMELSLKENCQTYLDVSFLSKILLNTSTIESNENLSMSYSKTTRLKRGTSGCQIKPFKSISIHLCNVSITISPSISDIIRFLNVGSCIQPEPLLSNSRHNLLRAQVLSYIGHHDYSPSIWDDLSTIDCQIKNIELVVPTGVSNIRGTGHSKLIFSLEELSFRSRSDVCYLMFENSKFLNLTKAHQIQDNVAELRGDVFDRTSHSILLMFHGINLTLDSAPYDSSTGSISNYILNSIDAEAFIILSQHNDLELWNQHINFYTSSMNVLFSNVHAKYISSAVDFVSNIMCVSHNTHHNHEVENFEPRLSLFSGISLRSLHVCVPFFSLSLIVDREPIPLFDLDPLSLNEIILEEALTDFLSQLACFDLANPPRKSIDASTRLCVDRICSLGLPLHVAQTCVSSALTSFLEELNYIRSSTSDIIGEISTDETFMESLSNLTQQPSSGNVVTAEDMKSSSKQAKFIDTNECVLNDVSANESVTSFDGSEESINIIETTMKHIVERIISTVVESLQSQTNHLAYKIVCVELESGFNMSLDQYFYDFECSIDFGSFAITTNRGINIVRFVPFHPSSQVVNNSSLRSSNALCMTIKLYDSNESFGNGGKNLSILASDAELEKVHRERSQELTCNVSSGLVEVSFSYIDVHGCIDTVNSILCELISKKKNTSDDDRNIQRKKSIKRIALYINIGNFTITLCSDNLQPFTSLSLKKICTEVSSSINPRKKHSTVIRVTSHSMNLINLTPHGQVYSDMICQFDDDTRSSMKVLELELYISCDSWKYSSELNINLSGLQIFVIRQYINEILQYTTSTEYGIGKLLAAFKKQTEASKHENLKPLKYQLNINHSCLMIPRNSRSLEITALEFEKIKLVGSYHHYPWKVPTVSELNGEAFTASPKKLSSDYRNEVIKTNSCINANSAFIHNPADKNDGEFFDCVEDIDFCEVKSPQSFNTTQGSSRDFYFSSDDESASEDEVLFSDLPILRFTVTLFGAKIFCGCSTKKHWIEANYEQELSSITNGLKLGKVMHGQSVFVKVKPLKKHSFSLNFSTFIDDVLLRKWEEITLAPIGLRIIIECSSHIRILIDDLIPNKVENPFSVSLRMSQLYLLLSTWYSNMQELPISFPYSDDTILEGTEISGCPLDWPEYGSDDFVKRMKALSRLHFEMAISLHKVVFMCSFDVMGYFNKELDFASVFQKRDINDFSETQAISILSNDCVIHMCKDKEGLFRLGCGANSLEILDGRLDRSGSPYAYSVEQTDGCGSSSKKNGVSIDLFFGLDFGHHTILETIDLPFKLSLFLTPDRWCLINLGLQSMNAMASNLSTVWVLLEYFGKYFKEEDFGNESFPASYKSDDTKDDASLTTREGSDDIGCLNIDFRLCLLNPHVAIPATVNRGETQFVILDCPKGFYYRYKSISYSYSSQEICSKDLRIFISNIYTREDRPVSSDMNSGQNVIIDGLSFGVQYDFFEKTNHMNLSVTIPLALTAERKGLKGIESPPLQVQPLILPEPTICKPVFQPMQNLGVSVCNITMNPRKVTLVSRVLYNLITGPNHENKGSDQPDFNSCDNPSLTFGITVRLSGARFYISDPALGMHLPVLVICVPSLELTCSKLKVEEVNEDSQIVVKNSDLQTCIDVHVWVDYFKSGLTRSWEPLLEPYHSIILYEDSFGRGKGITFSSECPFHFNISGALFDTLDDAIDLSSNDWRNFYDFSSCFEDIDCSEDDYIFSKNISNDESTDNSIKSLDISHQNLRPLESHDRVAYSILNLTGDRIRYHQKSSTSSTLINYLENLTANELKFQATRSVARNLQMVEIPFNSYDLDKSLCLLGDFRGAGHLVDIQITGFSWIKGVSIDEHGRHFVDLVPRSRQVQSKLAHDWRLGNAVKLLTDVSSLKGGRQLKLTSVFEIINKTSHDIQLAIHPDPRNTPELSETVSSDVVAGYYSDMKKTETISKESNSDHYIEKVEPNASFHIPLLLLESSLHLDGSHLGSLWIRPNECHMSDLLDALGSNQKIVSGKQTQSSIGFSSRPMQLAKIVHESAVLYDKMKGTSVSMNHFKTGIQTSCPIVQSQEEFIAPFCYCIEVCRSPVIQLYHESNNGTSDDSTLSNAGVVVSPSHSKDENFSLSSSKGRVEDKNKEESKKGNQSLQDLSVHAPIAYSLVIHPPIIIENFLPEKGRFELMHATQRKVVWWGELKTGESAAVHTVGLDAPLLLLMNLGFCRTPVGEGVLVHHGSRKAGCYPQIGLNRIGKAVNMSAMKVRKSLNSISETPNERAIQRIAQASSPNNRTSDHVRLKKKLGFDSMNDQEDTENSNVKDEIKLTYTVDDVVTETTVVDSLGQRLTLKISNVMGGGGQRKITLYCPYWIVNCTEHSLRYRQEGKTSFVSGTVHSSTRDGSRPVDGSTRNVGFQSSSNANFHAQNTPVRSCDRFDHSKRGTIFPGTPGALATSPGSCTFGEKDILNLLSKDIAVELLISMSFMFNFNDMKSPKMSVQLADTTSHSKYTSKWSRGFSLDSFGVTQTIGMYCVGGRLLEVSVNVGVAPGNLSQYTKIVRFCPCYVLVNQLSRPIRLWQNSSLLLHSNEVRSSEEHRSEQSEYNSNWVEKEMHVIGTIYQYEYLFGGTPTIDHRLNTYMPSGSTASPSALYVVTAGKNELIPFHLPNTRADRQFRIDFGPSWDLTSSFPADITGDYTLKLKRSVDFRLLRHVNTRGAPHYKVTLPPLGNDKVETEEWDGELGIWFETEWGTGHNIIVKGTKQAKFAYNNTDVHIGDELISIDNISVTNLSFNDTMKLLKERLAIVWEGYKKRELDIKKKGSLASKASKSMKPKFLKSLNLSFEKNSPAQNDGTVEGINELNESDDEKLVLIFRTLEERTRRARSRALKKRHFSSIVKNSTSRSTKNISTESKQASPVNLEKNVGTKVDQEKNRETSIHIEMKLVNQSIFIFVQNFDESNPPYRVENRAMNHTIYFRQRGCDAHTWNSLSPGESMAYSWEEPLKQKKLVVRVGNYNVLYKSDKNIGGSEVFSASNKSYEKNPIASKTDRKRFMRDKKKLKPFNYVENEEHGSFGKSCLVRLENIGFYETLQCPLSSDSISSNPKNLYCYVDCDGATRVLIITANQRRNDTDEQKFIENHLESISEQIKDEERKLETFKYLKNHVDLASLNRGGNGHEFDKSINSKHTLIIPGKEGIGLNTHVVQQRLQQIVEDSCLDQGSGLEKIDLTEHESNNNEMIQNVKDLCDFEMQLADISDLPEGTAITSTNQLLIEVIEAAGLKTTEFGGLSNPYCELVLNSRTGKRRKKFLSPRPEQKKRTYYVEKSVSPKWSGMVFLFDIPTEAVTVTRGYSIIIKVKSFNGIGKDPSLGMTEIHLRSLKNQRELVGWYPLMHRKVHGRETLHKFDRFRGSVKLRVQWIHSVPSLLKHHYMLSRRRLLDLNHRADGMVNQLNSLRKSSNFKRNKREPSLYTKMPNFVNKKTPIYSEQDLSLMNESKWKVSTLRQSMRLARERYLYSLHVNTEQSKKKRASSILRFPMQSSRQPLIMSDAALVPVKVSPFISKESSAPSKASGKQRSIRKSINPSSRTARKQLPESGRKRSSTAPEHYWREIGLLKSQHLDVLEPCQNSYFDQDLRDESERQRVVNLLYNNNILYHEAGYYFHRHFPTHNIHRLLSVSDMTNHIDQILSVSKRRVLNSIDQLRDWNEAYHILNCSKERKRLVSSPRDSTGYTFRKKILAETAKMYSNHSYPSLELPQEAPAIKHERNEFYLNNLYRSRASFGRTAERSVRSILSSGGWLTIRPITALNLPDTHTGMYVKMIYGTHTLMTHTVDAKVTPIWAHESNLGSPRCPSTESIHEKSKAPLSVQTSLEGNNFDDSNFNYSRVNDLQIYVEPLSACGSLRLSVVGANLKSKTELGVLQLPLASAIACCLESIEDEEHMKSLSFDSTPKFSYTRWFPLKNAVDCIPLEGDMGFSARPVESEKRKDNLFSQYFAPCIKLALYWTPDENSDYVNASASSIDCFQDDNVSSPMNSVTERYFQANIGSISSALIDSYRACELLSLSITDIHIHYSLTKPKTGFGCAIGWIQLDHQDENSRGPVIFAPTPMLHPSPTFQFLAIKNNLRSKNNIDSYQYMGLNIQEIDINIYETWMFDVWDFYMKQIYRHEMKKKACDRDNLSQNSHNHTKNSIGKRLYARDEFNQSNNEALFFIDEGKHGTSPSSNEKQSLKKIFIETLVLSCVKINFSYLKGYFHSADDAVNDLSTIYEFGDGIIFKSYEKPSSNTKAQMDQYQRWSEGQVEEEWIKSETQRSDTLPKLISSLFPAITDAPIRFSGKLWNNVFETPNEIVANILNYWRSNILIQVHRIIGSLDFVGNPTMVINSFMKGARDFVVQPLKEFLLFPQNPSRVGIGVAKGTLSLLSHSASGIFGFASKMSANAGRFAATLSFDETFKRWHNRQIALHTRLKYERSRKGKSNRKLLFYMLARPLEDIIVGVWFGATGLVVEPYKGAKLNGMVGFSKGAGIAMMGLVAKPLVGIFDACSHASESIQDLAKNINILDKKPQPVKRWRLPYSFGAKHLLKPYNSIYSRSMSLLRRFPPDDRGIKDEWKQHSKFEFEEIIIEAQVLHIEPGIDFYILVSNKRVVLFKLKLEGRTHSDSLCWQAPFREGIQISSSLENKGHNGIALYVFCYEQKQKETNLNLQKHKVQFSDEIQNFDTLDDAEHSIPYNNGGPLYQDLSNEPENPFEINQNILSDHSAIVSKEESLLTEENFSHESRFIQKPKVTDDFDIEDGSLLERYFVYGEFHHRSELSRIHNCICCVTQNFESILYEGIVSHDGSNDGHTSFGDYFFVLEDSSVSSKNQYNSDNLNTIPWIYESTDSSSERRCKWKFSDEMNASRAVGGPNWLINARARSTFVPMMLPSHPSYSNASDLIVQRTKVALERGIISLEEAIYKINHYLETPILSQQIQSHSSTLSSGEEMNEKLDMASHSIGNVFSNSDANVHLRMETPIISNSFFKDLNRLSTSNQSRQAILPSSHIDTVTDPYSLSENTGIHERLDKIDFMIGKLLSAKASDDVSLSEFPSNKKNVDFAYPSERSITESRASRNSHQIDQRYYNYEFMEKEQLEEEIKKLRTEIEEQKKQSENVVLDSSLSSSKGSYTLKFAKDIFLKKRKRR